MGIPFKGELSILKQFYDNMKQQLQQNTRPPENLSRELHNLCQAMLLYQYPSIPFEVLNLLNEFYFAV
jgi:hypothetical protein